MENHICIIGCGTFGSYLLKRLLEINSKDTAITVIEIGDKNTRTEAEAGLDSISEHSKVSKDGRYFGLGGTSARWGGQVLFFDQRDNPEHDPVWDEIVRINARYKDVVLKNLLGHNEKFDLQETQGQVKTGIWLKYAKRNLYNRLTANALQRVKLLTNQRVVDFELSGNTITKLVCKSRDGQRHEVAADRFYLTAGALESCRLLLALDKKTGLLNGTDLGRNFGDHISTELFTVQDAKPVLDGVDLTPRLFKGSLVTRRFVVATSSGTVGFLHPVLNKNVKSFKFLKELLFGKRTTTVTFAEFLGGFVFLAKFGFNFLFNNKLYVDKSQWSLQLDMEQPVPNANRLRLSAAKDLFGEAVLEIDWKISEADHRAIAEVRQQVENMLKNNQLRYKALYNPASTANKVEDVYHPVGCMRLGNDARAVVNFDGQVRGIANLYHFSTGIFPSAKSINPSAAVCCFVEAHLAAR